MLFNSIIYFILMTLFLIGINIIVFVKDYKENKRVLVEHHSIHKWFILTLSIISEVIITLFMFSSIIH